MYSDLAILALFLLLYSLASGRLDKTVFGGAILYTAFGFIAGPAGFGFLHFNVDGAAIRTLAEFTLALVLFTDAANADLGVLKLNLRIPERLLLISLPLTIILGFVMGLAIFDQLSWLETAILAVMLAPTDAALGKAVVTNTTVPARIREGLNVESGLNDGICVPFLLVFLTLASSESLSAHETTGLILREFAEEIGIGVLVGVGFTMLSAYALRFARARQWIGEIWQQIPVPALAMVCFAGAQTFGGSGFIASFAGGLFFGALARVHKDDLLRAAEGVGDSLALLTWVAFGVAVVGSSLEQFRWDVLLYAVLSLTIARMLPVYVSMTGMGLTVRDRLFLGWFGPRGLASIVFAVIVLDANLPGGNVLKLVVCYTVIGSILAHGISANPLASTYGRRNENAS
ncbi:MAG: cation:proton antiporter [Hyphomicrobiales bacterium]|nr:cation:proton antiporter [Hyphomicrobiales bacterium]